MTTMAVESRDITLRKDLETQLFQAQKIEAAGTLAGDIAHDFNNLLMGIQGYASLMLMKIDDSHPHYEKLKNIDNLVKKGATLISQLWGVIRASQYEAKSVILNDIIHNTYTLSGHIKKEIIIHEIYQENIWTTDINQGQIEQVLLNLYINASQAMPAGGDLYLETKNVMLDDHTTKQYQVQPGRYVKISVTDTGIGMDENIKAKISEPFSTTKEMGMGTGLGLATSYGIIKAHNGMINVYSEKGRGTTVNIYLPASDKATTREMMLYEEMAPGRGTMLLVNDKAIMIDSGKQMLESLGYQVRTAVTGKEAIDIFKISGETIELTIMDMVMPRISGKETYDSLQALDIGVKVIISRGFGIISDAKEIILRGCNALIQKPFNLNKLS